MLSGFSTYPKNTAVDSKEARFLTGDSQKNRVGGAGKLIAGRGKKIGRG